jgi:hypothetical protein
MGMSDAARKNEEDKIIPVKKSLLKNVALSSFTF